MLPSHHSDMGPLSVVGSKTKAESVGTNRRLTPATARPGAGATNSGGSERSWPQPCPEPTQEPEHRELLWSQEATRVQGSVIRERVPWRGRNTGKHALSFDESQEYFAAEKAGRSSREDTMSQGVGLGQCHCVGSSQQAGLWTPGQAVSKRTLEEGGLRFLRDSNYMGRR